MKYGSLSPLYGWLIRDPRGRGATPEGPRLRESGDGARSGVQGQSHWCGVRGAEAESFFSIFIQKRVQKVKDLSDNSLLAPVFSRQTASRIIQFVNSKGILHLFRVAGEYTTDVLLTERKKELNTLKCC